MFHLMPFRKRQQSGFPELFREMEDRFRRMWQEFPAGDWTADLGGDWIPRVDVKETEAEVKVGVELPGLEPEDLDISLDQNRLVIRGEKKQDREKEERGYHVVERSYGSFYRTIQLPAEVDSGKTSASFKHGVLHVVLGKKEEAKKQMTKVKVK